MFTEWHWLRYHFQGLAKGTFSALSFDFLYRCRLIETKIPGFTATTIDRMASICGREKFEPHYEQLLQLLAEVVIFYRLVEGFLGQPVEFHWEPTTTKSSKNPELMLVHKEWSALIEIKCPSMFDHMRNAAKNDAQLGARIADPARFDAMSTSGKATRPVDNKLKDYLVSAESKFAPFRDRIPKPTTFLCVVWTQYLFEAISPLINGLSGLFTEQSFYRAADGQPVVFDSVDAVIVSDHLQTIINGTREKQLPHGYGTPLDYGAFLMLGFQHPLLVENPRTSDTHAHPVVAVLGAQHPNETDDPRAKPLDFVMWLEHTPRLT